VIHGKVPWPKEAELVGPGRGASLRGPALRVIGYKPQVARSGWGFITGLLLPRGTRRTPSNWCRWSTKSSVQNYRDPRGAQRRRRLRKRRERAAMKARKIAVISINGSGPRPTARRLEQRRYALARDQPPPSSR
jgi:hypothetical protein